MSLARRIGRLEEAAAPDAGVTQALAALARLLDVPTEMVARLTDEHIETLLVALELYLAKHDLDLAADLRSRRLGLVPHAPRQPEECGCAHCETRRALREEARRA